MKDFISVWQPWIFIIALVAGGTGIISYTAEPELRTPLFTERMDSIERKLDILLELAE